MSFIVEQQLQTSNPEQPQTSDPEQKQMSSVPDQSFDIVSLHSGGGDTNADETMYATEAYYGANSKNESRFGNVSGIAHARVMNKSLEFLVLWEPGWVSAEEYRKGLEYPAYIVIDDDDDSTVLACWDPTWEPPTNLPHDKIRSYYTREPTQLNRHAKIYKELKQIMRGGAGEPKGRRQGYQLKEQSEESPKERGHKRKADELLEKATRKQKVDTNICNGGEKVEA